MICRSVRMCYTENTGKGGVIMPAVYAHYVFGKKVFRALPEKERILIRRRKDLFLLGLHGPDLLFYYKPVRKNRINQMGRRMHRELAAEFFEKGRMEWEKRKSEGLRVYLYGFLCHFILDSECHPYVNCYMEEKQVGHMEIETEFDRYLMELDGYDPLEYLPVHHLISRSGSRKEIVRMLDGVSEEQVLACVRGFRKTIAFFVCRSRRKKNVLRNFFRLIGEEKGIGGLIMDGEVNLDCQESDLFLEERLEKAVLTAVEEIGNYSSVLDGEGLLSARLYRNYEE